MSSLHEDPNERSPFWYCAFCNSDGRRSFKSTKRPVKGKDSKETAKFRAEAEEICRGWERAANLGQQGSLVEVQARKVLSEILERATGEPLNFVTTKSYLETWVASKKVSRAGGTAARYEHTVEKFIEQLGGKAQQGLAALTPRDLEAFRDSQLADGKSATTANMALKTLRIPLNLARRQGIILTNPAEAVELLPAQGESRDVFTPEQIRNILNHCDDEWAGLVLIARYCGLRLGDAVGLKWENFQPDGEHFILRFQPQKAIRGGKRRQHEMPVHPKIEAYFVRREKAGTRLVKGQLFLNLSKQRLGGCNGLSSQFQKIMHQAGVKSREDTRKLTGVGRSFNNLTFHSLRHTFISRLANAGVAKEVRMKLSGHTSEVHQRYTHHEIATLRQALQVDDGE